jgi:hypothetical protein
MRSAKQNPAPATADRTSIKTTRNISTAQDVEMHLQELQHHPVKSKQMRSDRSSSKFNKERILP